MEELLTHRISALTPMVKTPIWPVTNVSGMLNTQIHADYTTPIFSSPAKCAVVAKEAASIPPKEQLTQLVIAAPGTKVVNKLVDLTIPGHSRPTRCVALARVEFKP
jgi:hypothetical protein